MDEIQHWTVEKVVRNGRHGPYAVVQDRELGSITFSLVSEIWQEKRFPEPGSEVVLEDFQKKRAGWRAMSARFFRPGDIVNNKQRST
ncbi:MAG: hypothetical protein A2758_02645 [Candidatus Zambryskibacteria bacterium RIFCSPHIGHO2_01_FULL_49_18]|uniref:Uncharacterized protein n=2 Tax=Candidatus Zambryskiibacteriota TaxID=1817925 RepID=A0A1G2T245_9BACT|nr:MAG: hypothetical protein A2758_02645 [Candidatus Zambryskibacteria bacterium RIFCSPHIGHO2_01_FULL_49_18]OHB04975.1 MAG: hypothetical protein A3A26_00140 [Candidatus Zambryskibacteria bacterium RIFCSPLOWO2_01_FULL_47_14]